MINALATRISRIANAWSFTLSGVLALSLMFAANFADFSWTIPGFEKITHGAGILDMQWHYTPDDAYRLLGAQGETGRALYLRNLWTFDVIFPFAISVWLAVTIALASRASRSPLPAYVCLVPISAGMSDLLENSAITVLLLRFPERLDNLASLIPYLTSLKFFLYSFSLMIAVFVWLAIFLTRRSGQPGNLSSTRLLPWLLKTNKRR